LSSILTIFFPHRFNCSLLPSLFPVLDFVFECAMVLLNHLSESPLKEKYRSLESLCIARSLCMSGKSEITDDLK
jgi:hypothetical protein